MICRDNRISSKSVRSNNSQAIRRRNKAKPVVLYCLSSHCRMSYSDALRAINMGYSNVFWYRSGIEAWKPAGLPTASPNGYSN